MAEETYDPRFNFDGKSTPLVLPPAYELSKITNETYTAEGPISYWNAYVAVTQMHGQGSFSDPRLRVNIVQQPDLCSAYAARTSQKKYRTTPVRGLWQHPPYFHDGSAKTLEDVVAHYTRVRNLRLTDDQKKDLVEYLKSL